eukprot:4299018-Prymnesium_polylepis.1
MAAHAERSKKFLTRVRESHVSWPPPAPWVAATHSLGMLMTAGGSDDDKIKVQGLTGPCTFNDADGGSEGAESEVEQDDEEGAEVEGEDGAEAASDDEVDSGMEDSEEEDDTVDRFAVCGEAPKEPPVGYVCYVPVSPPLISLDDKKALVGKKVLTARIDDGACGWFLGTVTSSAVGARDKKKVPTATHVVTYTKKDFGTKDVVGTVATELSSSNYGSEEWWLLLEPV